MALDTVVTARAAPDDATFARAGLLGDERLGHDRLRQLWYADPAWSISATMRAIADAEPGKFWMAAKLIGVMPGPAQRFDSQLFWTPTREGPGHPLLRLT